MIPRILVTGKHGQVGWELQRTLAPLGEITAVDVADVDLTDREAVCGLLRTVRPQLVVNPAAYTAVDLAEQQAVMAHLVNAVAPGILAEEAQRQHIPIVHYSTDYVFDGTKTTPYTEDDCPNPTNVYGRTKLAGEENVVASGARHVILRLEWVYGARGKNFLRTMLRLGRERRELQVVDDQVGAPTWCRTIAEGTAQIVRIMLAGEGIWDGVYHMTAGGQTTWCGFAREIFTQFEALLPQMPVVKPISTSDYPTPAQRPTYSVLANDKMRIQFGVQLPSWDAQLRLLAAEFVGGQPI